MSEMERTKVCTLTKLISSKIIAANNLYLLFREIRSAISLYQAILKLPNSEEILGLLDERSKAESIQLRRLQAFKEKENYWQNYLREKNQEKSGLDNVANVAQQLTNLEAINFNIDYKVTSIDGIIINDEILRKLIEDLKLEDFFKQRMELANNPSFFKKRELKRSLKKMIADDNIEGKIRDYIEEKRKGYGSEVERAQTALNENERGLNGGETAAREILSGYDRELYEKLKGNEDILMLLTTIGGIDFTPFQPSSALNIGEEYLKK